MINSVGWLDTMVVTMFQISYFLIMIHNRKGMTWVPPHGKLEVLVKSPVSLNIRTHLILL